MNEKKRQKKKIRTFCLCPTLTRTRKAKLASTGKEQKEKKDSEKKIISILYSINHRSVMKPNV
jgi:hypothetical protein